MRQGANKSDISNPGSFFPLVLEVSRDSSRPLGDQGRPDWETSSDIFYSKSETGNRDGKKVLQVKTCFVLNV